MIRSLNRFDIWSDDPSKRDPYVDSLVDAVLADLPPDHFAGGPKARFSPPGPLDSVRLAWTTYFGSLAAVAIQLSIPEINAALRAHSRLFDSPREARKRGLVTASYDAGMYGGDNRHALRSLAKITEVHANIPVTLRGNLREPVQRSAFYCGLRATEILTGKPFTEDAKQKAWEAERRIDISLGITDDIRCASYAEAEALTRQQIHAIRVTPRLKEQMTFLFDSLPVYLRPVRGSAERVVAEILGERVSQELGLPQHRDVLGPVLNKIASHPDAVLSKAIDKVLLPYLLLGAAYLEPLGTKSFQHSRGSSGLGIGLAPSMLS